VSRPPSILGLAHVQLAMPAGAEDTARQFYSGVLGLAEIAKPPNLAVHGGVWFALGEQQLHLGVEDEFRPARKAHPAILVQDVEDLRRILTSSGFAPIDDEPLAGFRRFYTADPFGNRLEFLERVPDQPAIARPKKGPPAPRFTDKQGQYLAFILSYIRMYRRAPAETDIAASLRCEPAIRASDGRDAGTPRAYCETTGRRAKHRTSGTTRGHSNATLSLWR
jgi:catechol 2,3-dioxygenase-like lactoylglutathione lyase family enzyme